MKTFAAILLLASSASCPYGVRSDYVLTATPRAPYSGPVKVILDGAPITGTFSEVGIVSATGGGADATLGVVLGQLQAQTAALGCNAVIRVRYDQGASNSTATGVAVWFDSDVAGDVAGPPSSGAQERDSGQAVDGGR